MEYDHFWWLPALTDREANEIRMALDYVQNYNHGTPGHLDLLIIAKLANVAAVMIESLIALGVSEQKIFETVIPKIIDGMLIAPKPQP